MQRSFSWGGAGDCTLTNTYHPPGIYLNPVPAFSSRFDPFPLVPPLSPAGSPSSPTGRSATRASRSSSSDRSVRPSTPSRRSEGFPCFLFCSLELHFLPFFFRSRENDSLTGKLRNDEFCWIAENLKFVLSF